MPRPRVYVETTIPSFYYPLRNSPEVVELRDVTRAWWARVKVDCELVTGSPVKYELEAGTGLYTPLRLALLDDLGVLGRTPLVTATARELIKQKVMPGDPSLDAYHLALAMRYDCDVLATWDRSHLANPNKATHLRRIAERLGLAVPAILTPLEHLRRMDERAR